MSEARLLKPEELGLTGKIQMFEDDIRTEENLAATNGGILIPNMQTVPALL